ncbi:MAG: tetratricopeptide repeat protein [Cyanobacteria bacterium J06631_9]
MSQAELFTELTGLVEVDPFALLGISVSADEKRIAKRYRQVAKQLHPDALTGTAADTAADATTDAATTNNSGLTATLAAQVIARIVNPSYQKLKQEKTRQATLSMIRLRVRRLVRTEKLVPTFSDAQQLAVTAEDEVDIFYEQALSKLADSQFVSLEALYTHSLEISQLNLVYLRRKLSDLVIRPKRVGLMTNAITPTAAASSHTAGSVAPSLLDSSPAGGATTAATQSETDYLGKHLKRAKTYLGKKNYEQAVHELREALKLAPQSPEIHSMLGQAYFKQKLSGMAKAHFRQALKLKPTHKVAQKYGKLLGLQDEPITQSPSPAKPPDEGRASSEKKSGKGAWFGRLLNRDPSEK